MTRPLPCLALAVLAAGAASAQTWSGSARGTLLASALDTDDSGGWKPPEPAPALMDAELSLTGEQTFATGLQLRMDLGVRLQADHPDRPGFAGVFGFCPPGTSGCPRRRSAAGYPFTLGPDQADNAPAAYLDIASLTLSGPLGELQAGLDAGAATRLDARPPRLFESVSAGTTRLDPTGLGLARARNDAAGNGLKLTALSPRWLGFRAGASFTPEAVRSGPDYDPAPDFASGAPVRIRNVSEAALSFSRRSSGGLETRLGLTLLEADVRSDGLQARRSSLGAGAEISRGGWTGGLRWRSSELSGPGQADRSVEFGLVREWGEGWRAGLEAASSRHPGPQIKGDTVLIGAGRTLPGGVSLGLGYIASRLTTPSGVGAATDTVRSRGFVLEASVRYK